MLRTTIISSAVIVILLALYAGYVAVRIKQLIAVSTKLVEVSKPYRQQGNGIPRILVLGDSTAVGTGTQDPRGSVAGRFGQDYPNAEIVNLSINGLEAAQLDANFPSYPAKYFDLVLLQIGANDVIQRTPLPEFASSLESIFKKANHIGTNVVALHGGNIGLAPIFSAWPINRYFRFKSLQLRSVYKDIAAQHNVLYIDLFQKEKDDVFIRDIQKFYAADGIHLTEAGYGQWYERIRSEMEDALMRL